MTYFYLNQLPVFSPEQFSQSDVEYVVPRVVELTYTSRSMTDFACDLGYDDDPFEWDEQRRASLRAELDAWAAQKYGVTKEELRYILDPSEVLGSDYPSETFRVLKNKEISLSGYFLTAQIVMSKYDEKTTIL